MLNSKIEQIVICQKKNLEKLNENIEQILTNSPKGNLNIHKRNHEYRFEIHLKESDSESSKNIYISRTSKDFKKYAEKYCAASLQPLVNKALATLDAKPENYDPEIITTRLGKLEALFGENVPVCFETRNHYIERWSKADFRKNPYPFDPTRTYTTARGERVRSKNELLCANFVHSCKLPYRVDAELRMSNGKSRFPDLIILNPQTLKEEYLEIMGRMSDPDYVDENLLKIREYEASGYRLGDRLHLFFESEKTPFDFEFFKSEIRRLYLN